MSVLMQHGVVALLGFVVLHFREMLISFGGLLMQLKGDSSDAKRFELDQRLFLLIRKV